MNKIRPDILSDLYKAIDEFTEQLSNASSISDLAFGNVIQLRDELEAGKRYSEIDERYSIWIDCDRENLTLVKGTDPLKFVNGDVDPECDKCLHTFVSGSFELASEYYNDWLLKNIGIFPK